MLISAGLQIIAQSSISAFEINVFSNRLVIVIHPDAVEKSKLNLFEVKDHHHLS